jgi:hypothetical protein
MCIHKISQGKVVGYYIAVDNCSTTKEMLIITMAEDCNITTRTK